MAQPDQVKTPRQALSGLSSSSLRVGAIQGIDVRVHVTFALWLLYTAMLWPSLLFLVALNVVLFGSVFLHELGHCYGCRRVGGTAREIVMHPLGGLARLAVPRQPWAELVATAAGPAVSLGLALLGLVLAAVSGLFGQLGTVDWGTVGRELNRMGGGLTPFALVAGLLLAINGGLFALNILPLFPLDGGRILRALLWKPLGYLRATYLAGAGGLLFGLAAMVWGFLTGNFLIGILGIYLLYMGQAEIRIARRLQAAGALPATFHDDDLMPHERARR
jgi:Zn-dependent protease